MGSNRVKNRVIHRGFNLGAGGQLMCVLAMVINAFRCLGVRFDDFAFLRLNWSRHSGVKSGVK